MKLLNKLEIFQWKSNEKSMCNRSVTKRRQSVQQLRNLGHTQEETAFSAPMSVLPLCVSVCMASRSESEKIQLNLVEFSSASITFDAL